MLHQRTFPSPEGEGFTDPQGQTLNRDQYSGLGLTQTNLLEKLTTSGYSDDPNVLELARELSAGGLLTTIRGKAIKPVQLEHPSELLLGPSIHPQPALRIHHLVRFIHAFALARIILKRKSVRHAVFRVQRRKTLSEVRKTRLEIEKTRNLLSIFRYLRPLFYAAREQCLLDSLVLVEFLAHYQIYPTWVFGVKAMPFMAHCWVQYGRFALSSYPTSLKAFTPIMTI